MFMHSFSDDAMSTYLMPAHPCLPLPLGLSQLSWQVDSISDPARSQEFHGHIQSEEQGEEGSTKVRAVSGTRLLMSSTQNHGSSQWESV